MDPEFTPLHHALEAHLAADGPRATTLQQRVDRAAQSPTGGRADSALDRAVLDLLGAQGWWAAPVTVNAVPWSRDSRAVHHGAWTVRDTVLLSQDLAGRVRPLAPDPELGAWDDRPSQDSWSHWATLLHEAAHTVGLQVSRPFRTERLPADTVEDLNALLFGPLATPATRQEGFFHRCLQENFADVLSVMLLHRLAPGDPGVEQEVANLIWARRTIRERDFDPHLARRQLLMSAPQQTDLAVARAWATRPAWQELPPKAQIETACDLASAGVLDLIQPGRPMGAGVLDDRLVRVLGREAQDFLHTSPLTDLVAHDLAAPKRSRLPRWRAAYPHHPAWPLMDRLVGQLLPDGRFLREVAPRVTLRDRVELARTFLDRGVRHKGAVLRTEIQDRSEGIVERLIEALSPDARMTPPSSSGRPRPRR